MGKKLDLNLGAGNAIIDKLEVENKAEIEGGVGRLEISDGTINNLHLSMGVGESILNAKLLGKSEIEAGIGSVKLNLTGKEEDYKIKVEKGIGSIKLQGENLKNETTYGNGINIIDLEGGIGNIDIRYLDK